MNKIIRKQLNKKSLCSSRGFSLVETLITVLLLLIVSSLAAMAISFGTVEYKKSMNQSLAQMLYSTLETALESHLQYADETNANYVLQDGMLYLESGTELKPVLEKAAYTDLNLKNFDLNYDSAKHCFTVNFSVCSGDEVLIDGEKYSFDVFSLPLMLGFSNGEASGYKNQLVQKSAKNFEEPLNAVLKILYDEVVYSRLGGESGQVSMFMFNNGKVTDVYSYKDSSDTKGQVLITNSVNLYYLNNKIISTLESMECKVTGTCRIFYDRDGICISNCTESGSYMKIGGQGACGNLTIWANKANNYLYLRDDSLGWYKGTNKG